jgi:hypothetical protein
MDSQVIWILAATNRTDYQNIADLLFYVRWHLIPISYKREYYSSIFLSSLYRCPTNLINNCVGFFFIQHHRVSCIRAILSTEKTVTLTWFLIFVFCSILLLFSCLFLCLFFICLFCCLFASFVLSLLVPG